MQNHYVISSKYQFWIRDVPNSTKSPDVVMSGPVQWLFMSPETVQDLSRRTSLTPKLIDKNFLDKKC